MVVVAGSRRRRGILRLVDARWSADFAFDSLVFS